MNMKKWFADVMNSSVKKPFPILSFPCVSLLNVNVKQLTSSAELMSAGMKAICDKCDTLASVSMMDLSVEAEAFGANVNFSENEVPTVVGAIANTPEKVDSLQIPPVNAKRCGIYVEAVKQAKQLITDRPVFAGGIGPFSLAGRLMDVSEIMINCYEDPDMVHALLEKVTEFLINYFNEYKKVGANGILMAEPLAGMLSPSLVQEFSSDYVKKIVDAVQTDEFAVIYHNCGDNVYLMSQSILSTGATAYHFGNSVSMSKMLDLMPNDVAVMGNVDPAGQIKKGTPESVKQETLRILGECNSHSNFIISSGCDIPHDSSWQNVLAFFNAVSEFYGEK